MSSHQLFVQLLEQLTIADNAIRSASEKHYEVMKADVSVLPFLPLSLLEALADTTVAAHVRQLAAVLLRRLLVEQEDSVYRSMDLDKQLLFRTNLLICLTKEVDHLLKARICDIAGDLAGIVLEHNEWPEILTYSQCAIQSSNAIDRETGLALLGMLSGSHAPFFASSSSASLLSAIFCQCLSDVSNEGRVMLAAIRAFCNLLAALPQESDFDNFQTVIGPMMNGLVLSIDRVTTEELSEAVAITYSESLINLAEDCPGYFIQQLDQVFNAIINIIERTTLQSSVRRMLVEFLVCICTSSHKKVRKMKGPNGEKHYFALKFFPICARLMWGVLDHENWSKADITEEEEFGEDNDNDEMQNSDMGETALDRVAQSLGLRSTFSIISNQLSSLLGSPIWQHQRAGLRIMGNYLEVSARITDKNQLIQHRNDVSNTLTNFTRSTHPQVRAAAYYAICQLYVMQGRDLPIVISERLLDVILNGMVLSSNPSPRVRRNAILCLMNLIDSSPSNLLESWGAKILIVVMNCLKEGPVIVQECCVSCIVSFAESIKGNLIASYYDSIMPILQQLLRHAQVSGLESLWGQTMECCAIVGEASGKEKFKLHALEMMQMLESELSDESEARKYFMKAWVRIARCLGVDFLPFLPMVTTKLLVTISQDLSSGTGGIDLEELEQRSDVEIIETEDGWVAVRTSAVEEQEHFYPYVEETVRAMVPMLNSPHEDVRSYSLVALPEFIRATGKATQPDRVALHTITDYAIGLLITAVEKEGALELIMTALQAMKLVLHYCSQDWASWAALTNPIPLGPFSFQSTPGSVPKSTLTAALTSENTSPTNSSLKRPLGTDEPPAPTPDKSCRFLNIDQMVAIAQSAKIVFRDSIQRRAVLRAEAQVAGGGDEDDVADEALFMQESLELHYNVADLIGSVFKTHGPSFTPVYLEHWHEMITEMGHVHCLKEDRQFSYFVISDVIEFGLTSSTAISYLASVIPMLCEACATMADAGPRQVCAFALGRASELHPQGFAPYALSVLQALGGCVAAGEGPGESRGECTDNAVASVGLILERIVDGNVPNGISSGINFEFMWGQWLDYLPLKHDLDEGGKVLIQLARLVGQRHDSLLARGSRLSKAVGVLLNVLDSEYSSPEVSKEIVRSLQKLHTSAGINAEELIHQFVRDLGSESGKKLENILGVTMNRPFVMASSPLATAPIHDVLLRR